MQEKGRLGSKKTKKKGEKRRAKKNQGRAHKKLGAPLFSGSSQIGKKTERGQRATEKGLICPLLAAVVNSFVCRSSQVI